MRAGSIYAKLVVTAAEGCQKPVVYGSVKMAIVLLRRMRVGVSKYTCFAEMLSVRYEPRLLYRHWLLDVTDVKKDALGKVEAMWLALFQNINQPVLET